MSIPRGRAWLFDNDVDTDVLAPGLYMKGPMEEMARHCLESVNPDFAANVEAGDIILAGSNFGIGSSREQAAQVLTMLGIGAVVARSFGGIFYRNALNFGLLAVTSQADLQVAAGDVVSVDGVAGIVTNELTAETFACDPVPEHLMDMVAAGGLVPHLEQRLNSEQEAR
jgi:3-isopropylmalate/(R)-2-methylmalate dehydratase small subunit